MDKIFLRDVDLDKISNEYELLSKKTNHKLLSRLGNNIVDYFTLKERLNTKSKVGISFIEFWNNYEFYKQKKYVKNMIDYCEAKQRYTNQPQHVAKEIFCMYFGSIKIFKPLSAIEIYSQFPQHRDVLDPTMGWGGRLVGGCICNINSYTGIDSNLNLEKPYADMTDFLVKRSTTKIQTHFCDAVNFDYSRVFYNMVFTSPPYEAKEIYTDMKIPKDWFNDFYDPLFTNIWKHLQPDGLFILNIPEWLYEKYAILSLGQATEILPFSKSKRNINNYTEYYYVWVKQKEAKN